MGQTLLQALRGTQDLLPGASAGWHALEERLRACLRAYHYREIRTPLLEDVALFQRSVGETTDIVQKEMYVFADRGGRQIALRPEATASIVRAYIEHSLDKQGTLAKLYYLGPMFRGERPQAGRLRQFHQIGVEAIGSTDPLLDAEVIALAHALLAAAGLRRMQIALNTVGCPEDKQRNAARLKQSLATHEHALCEDCRSRLTRNVFRVLDCKQSGCRNIVRQVVGQGPLLECCAACRTHFQMVKDALRALGVTHTEDPAMVRGLDYYTRTVFEVTHPALGAKDAVGAGGRYDRLVADLGGPETGAIGFALGWERLIMAVEEEQPEICHTAAATQGDIFIVTLTPEARAHGLALAQQLRREGLIVDMDFEERSLKAQLRQANRGSFAYAALLGASELRDGVVTLKDLKAGTQEQIPTERLADELRQRCQR